MTLILTRYLNSAALYSRSIVQVTPSVFSLFALVYAYILNFPFIFVYFSVTVHIKNMYSSSRNRATERHLPHGITVLPATRHRWARPALSPAMQAGTRFTYTGGMEGWVDLVTRKRMPPGVELATSQSESNALIIIIITIIIIIINIFTKRSSVAHLIWSLLYYGVKHVYSVISRYFRECG